MDYHQIHRVARESQREFTLPFKFTTVDTRETLTPPMLLDTSCMRSSINHSFVVNNNLTMQPMEKPYQTYNGNMTPNRWVKEYVSLEVESVGKGGVIHHK